MKLPQSMVVNVSNHNVKFAWIFAKFGRWFGRWWATVVSTSTAVVESESSEHCTSPALPFVLYLSYKFMVILRTFLHFQKPEKDMMQTNPKQVCVKNVQPIPFLCKLFLQFATFQILILGITCWDCWILIALCKKKHYDDRKKTKVNSSLRIKILEKSDLFSIFYCATTKIVISITIGHL